MGVSVALQVQLLSMNFPRKYLKIHPVLVSVENGAGIVFKIKKRQYELLSGK
jgi:hypothetical protein